ncbi:hypothetical protein IWZ03DRAFT_72009 [Phyllosticta citriasiana]|uniref:Uncharacterized protein n=1 Tax=Phyllosticta citriasiana TaxID=595635 RepID=A0ABR1KG17_9PEZI
MACLSICPISNTITKLHDARRDKSRRDRTRHGAHSGLAHSLTHALSHSLGPVHPPAFRRWRAGRGAEKALAPVTITLRFCCCSLARSLAKAKRKSQNSNPTPQQVGASRKLGASQRRRGRRGRRASGDFTLSLSAQQQTPTMYVARWCFAQLVRATSCDACCLVLFCISSPRCYPSARAPAAHCPNLLSSTVSFVSRSGPKHHHHHHHYTSGSVQGRRTQAKRRAWGGTTSCFASGWLAGWLAGSLVCLLFASIVAITRLNDRACLYVTVAQW